MKWNVKTSVLTAIAKIGMASARIGANSVSIWGYYQPKEPRSLQERKKK